MICSAETPSAAEPEGILTFLPGEIRAAVAVRQPGTFASIMNYTTFDKSGIEVLRLGMQWSNGNAWPIEHWRTHPERWRLFSPAIDAYISERLAGKDYGGRVTGLLLALETADFRAWPLGPFRWGVAPVSFLRSSRQIRVTAQLMWPEIGALTLTKQFNAYADAVLASVGSMTSCKQIPKDFNARAFRDDLALAFQCAKPSRLTRASFLKRDV